MIRVEAPTDWRRVRSGWLMIGFHVKRKWPKKRARWHQSDRYTHGMQDRHVDKASAKTIAVVRLATSMKPVFRIKLMLALGRSKNKA
jgi:hypothetical protein